MDQCISPECANLACLMVLWLCILVVLSVGGAVGALSEDRSYEQECTPPVHPGESLSSLSSVTDVCVCVCVCVCYVCVGSMWRGSCPTPLMPGSSVCVLSV